MKRISAKLLLLAMLASLTACGGEGAAVTTSTVCLALQFSDTMVFCIKRLKMQ